MKKYFIVFYWLLFSLIIFILWGCSNQKLKIQDAQSQNVEFLIKQAEQLWEQRSDSSSVIKANYILGLADNVEKNNKDIVNIYSRSLFFQGMFLENDKLKKDSLFFKGAEIAKYFILNDSLFKSIFNETIGDENFKMLSALSIAPKQLVPGMYWWATNKLWYLNNKSALERINHRELLEVIMHRIIALEPDYLYGGPYRFFGIFYSRIPGVEINQSKIYFEKAINAYPNYFGNKVQMSEFYHQKAENKNLFNNQLNSIISLDPTIDPNIISENLFYQKRAMLLLDQKETLFE
tara:strand:- start:1065 stop:1940 length:876 start_codon:yes stop_codon:yes gene_type:complete